MEKNKCYKVVDENGVTQTVWDGRYTCVAAIVFSGDQNGEIRILANKRGSGCPKEIGKWNVPCGFLDAGSGEENAAREVFEETGIQIPVEEFVRIGIKIDDEERNVTVYYMAGVSDMPAPVDIKDLTGEPNEVEEIKWIPFKELENYEWAFDHDVIIRGLVDRIMKQ